MHKIKEEKSKGNNCYRFTLKIHHGGKFVEAPQIYVGGKVDYIENCDPKKWSLQTLNSIGTTKLRYIGLLDWHFKLPETDIDNGYIQCLTDEDCNLMVKTLLANRFADVYVTHPENVPKVQSQVSFTEFGTDSRVHFIELDKDNGNNQIGKSSDTNINLDESQWEGAECNENKDNDDDMILEHFEDDEYNMNDNEELDDLDTDPDCEWLGVWGTTQKDKGIVKLKKKKEKIRVKENKKEKLTQEGGVSAKEKKQRKQSKKDKVLEKNNSTTFAGLLLKHSSSSSEYEKSDNESKYDESDDMVSLNGEDDVDQEDVKREKITFMAATDMVDPTFRLGMEFTGAAEFRAALRAYSIKNNRAIRFKKNESGRISAKCSDGCPWRIYASRKESDDPTIVVKTLVDEHSDSCLFVYANKNVKSRMIAKTYLHYLRKHPDVSVGDFMETIHEEMNVEVSVSQVYRAKKIAKEMIEGHYKEQYAKLEDYCAELMKRNPGSTVLLETEPHNEDNEPVFKRIYICLDACKRGWKAGCRPLIGMDGCFLKGPYGGQLLTAIGIDSDNGMFPIAYAVVEKEDKQNWKWFLSLLVDDLRIRSNANWCLITDKQKGLEGAIYELVPQVEHRHCIRHLCNNFKKEHKGLSLKTRVWNAAMATYLSKYKYEMDMLEKEDKEARKWFNNKPPKFWSKSHFRTTTKCDMLLNNLCESFNGTKPILRAREKPILGLLEGVRMYLMKRMNQKRESILKHQGSLCPRIRKLVEKRKAQSATSIPTWAGQMLFQVKTMYGEQFSVDLNEKACSCRGWDLTGIPCSHAMSCIFNIRGNPEQFINDYYETTTQMRIYEPVIAPMDGPDMWEPTGLPVVRPPNYEPKRGKLAKNRRKEQDEIEASKRKTSEMRKKGTGKKQKQDTSKVQDTTTKVTKLRKRGKLGRCSKCLQAGHNKLTCNKERYSLNSRTPYQDTQTVQEQSKIATTQSEQSTQIHYESNYSTGQINKPSKFCPQKPREDDSFQRITKVQIGSTMINAEKYMWNGRNCVTLQGLQNAGATMMSKKRDIHMEETD